jgi:2'-5' RNA ligase
MSSTARLFIALWPSPDVRAALVRHQKSWEWSSSARLTRPERLHVTLHFLGEVAARRVEELRYSLAIPAGPFELKLVRPETWRGGLAVLCADEVPAALANLHEALAERLKRELLPVDDRPLRVHVTLARQAQRSAPPQSPEPIAWPVAAGYSLVRSLPGGQGYETIQRFS